ncbi:MAG: MBL fold metallo-hydrolase [Salinisphaera sp.]|nr:MBL fold metallo-hydrolase [Salinisphaera sp.]
MKIHHLNCGTMQPLAGPLLYAGGQPAFLCCHVLLVEMPEQLVLIDSGVGLADIAASKERLGGAFVQVVRPRLDAAETARSQVEALGFAADDVRDIVLTHLDVDHVGGIADFPRARVHVLATEHAAAHAVESLLEKQRYRRAQWGHGPNWVLHEPDGEAWNGFAAARGLAGMAPDILMIPLAGHTRGHAGIAVDTGDGWLLHAGDAYFHHGQLSAHSSCPLGLAAFQRMMCENNRQRAANVQRLRELALSAQATVEIICAHDPREWQSHTTHATATRRTARSSP